MMAFVGEILEETNGVRKEAGRNALSITQTVSRCLHNIEHSQNAFMFIAQDLRCLHRIPPYRYPAYYSRHTW
jgi:hypothetical protein